MLKWLKAKIDQTIRGWLPPGNTSPQPLADASAQKSVTGEPAGQGDSEMTSNVVPLDPYQHDEGYQKLLAAYRRLKQPQVAGKTPGYDDIPGYPPDFQANEFPKLARDGEVKMLGANQAFYFTHTNREPGIPAEERVKLDTTQLKILMRNVYDNGTRFTLMLDADTLDNHERFAQKYLGLREEPDANVMQWRENELIAGFIQSGGVKELAKEVIREKNAAEGKKLPENAIDVLAGHFLKSKFRLAGVQLEQPLDGAVWEVDGPEGKLCARQTYSQHTRNINRRWQIGTMPELEQLASQQPDTEVGRGAGEVLQAVENMNTLPSRDLQSQQSVSQQYRTGRGGN